MKNEILKILTGSKESFSRDYLSIHFNMTDRTIRECIAELQSEGHKIISLTKGYKLAVNGELEQYIAREKRRAISILAKLTHLKPKIKELCQQLELL